MEYPYLTFADLSFVPILDGQSDMKARAFLRFLNGYGVYVMESQVAPGSAARYLVNLVNEQGTVPSVFGTLFTQEEVTGYMKLVQLRSPVSGYKRK